jgi:uridine kinase
VTPERLAVLALVADALPDLDRPLLVAVDGADGAGKTWFADELAMVLGERERPVVRASVDDFHHPQSYRHELGRTGETVWARSFDYRALRRELLDPWCAGAGTSYRSRHHNLATDALLAEPTATVPEHGVLIVDGVFAQREELRDCWDLVVWLEVPDEERVRRMVGRDGTPADLAHGDQRRYLDAQRIYRAVADPVGSADFVVDNTDSSAPSLATRSVAPPGWRRVGDLVERTIVTDADTAEAVNRLLMRDGPGSP